MGRGGAAGRVSGVLVGEFLELRLEIAQHPLLALGFLVGEETDAHAFDHVAGEVEAEHELLALALPFGEQFAAGLVPLALECLLRGEEDRREFLVGARGDRDLEEGDEPRVFHVRPVALDAEADMIAVGRLFRHGLAERAQPLRVQVVDGGADDVHFRGEVVQHRPARQPGLFRDLGGRGAAVAEFDETGDCRFDDLRAGRRALLGLPTAADRQRVVRRGLVRCRGHRPQRCRVCLKKSRMIETG